MTAKARSQASDVDETVVRSAFASNELSLLLFPKSLHVKLSDEAKKRNTTVVGLIAAAVDSYLKGCEVKPVQLQSSASSNSPKMLYRAKVDTEERPVPRRLKGFR